jgi:hypothetical protein
MSVPWALFPISFRIPRKEPPPNTAPAKRDAPFPEPSNYLLKFPVNRLPSFPQRAPTETGTRLQNFYTISSKSPVNEPPPPTMFPTRGEKFPFQSQWFNHSSISVGVPNKEPSHKKRGKTFGHCPRSPTWMEGLHTVGCGMVPQGDPGYSNWSLCVLTAKGTSCIEG